MQYRTVRPYKRILIIANDTDIGLIVLGIEGSIVLQWYWRWQTVVLFGIGGINLRNISINGISSALRCLPPRQLFPHSLPWQGQITHPSFPGKGKKSAYAKWSTRPELATTLCHLKDKPETPSSDDIAVIESFVISLYSVSCTQTVVNQARQQIFAQSSRTFEYCITLYFRGRKISRKVNLKYFREKIFSRIYCSRENIFPRKYLPAKISSRENIFPRKYPPAKIVCLFRQRSFLFAVCCPVIGDTGSRPNVRSWIRITPAQQWHNSHHFESRSFLYLADEKYSARFFLK